MKFASSLFLSCFTLLVTIAPANATYRYENGIKFYIIGSKGESPGPRGTMVGRKRVDARNDPVSTVFRHTFVHLVPVWGGTQCGSSWTEIMVPDSFTSPAGSVNFASACKKHDRCYRLEKGKRYCDDRIHANLKRVCRKAFPEKHNHLRTECLAFSGLYFNAVTQIAMGYPSSVLRQANHSYRFIRGKARQQYRPARQWITGRKRIRFSR